MKKLARQCGQLLAACLMFSVTTAPAFAVDSSAYTGVWTNQTPSLTLKIDGNQAEITIDGKTYTKPTLQYTQNQLPGSPFLYLDSRTNAGKQAHQFYLMVGSDAQNQPQLNGYYDQVTLNEAGEKLITASFPLSLQQRQQQAAATTMSQ